ncbi:MAG: glutamine-hydrolyzing carbamoyl-phosphate synthase small subunit [Brachymonas sp.]|nr:glutamine-hydrolyzing carbamoyl-phosphate synthase small subunit [Brachymonas sp.]
MPLSLHASLPSALLALSDGTCFVGNAIGVAGQAIGEVVFNTSVAGYQEILTDPASTGQIVAFTYPHIGNYGTNAEDAESGQVRASGLVIRDLPLIASNFRSEENLQDYLRRNGTVAIANIDTRKLTRHIREHGAQQSCIVAFDSPVAVTQEQIDQAVAAAKNTPSGHSVANATCASSYAWNEGGWTLGGGYSPAPTEQPFKVVVLDLGVRQETLRMLVQRGCQVTVVPATTTAEAVLALQPDGVVLSSGPGDPQSCSYAVDLVRKLLQHKLPVFGIGLGYQVLALASGATTRKLKAGRYGGNYPVKDLDTGNAVITSQNHGFAVNAEPLPSTLRATHTSLFDDTVQGVQHTDAPAFSVQWYPGGHQFDQFTQLMRTAQQTQGATA